MAVFFLLDEIASCDRHASSMGIECTEVEETSSRRNSNTSITTVSVQRDTEETTAQSDEGVVTDQLQSVVPSVDDGELSYQL